MGLKRQGKSHMLNRLIEKIGGMPGMFKAQKSKNSITKGLWILTKMFPYPKENPKVDVIFIDAEGSGEKGRGGKTFDAKVFMLAMLLSSHLVYNMKDYVATENI